MDWRGVVSALTLLLMIPAWAASPGAESSKPQSQATVTPDFRTLKNFNTIADQTGLRLLYASKNVARLRVRVAVLDNAFVDYEKARGRTLPEDVQFHAGPIAESATAETPHGVKMAEALYDFATNQGRRKDLAPEIHLFRSGGISNLRAAIDEAIRLKVDIILHPIVRDFGSNFDGKGIYNKEVSRAINAGILWINAAGNYGQTTFNQTKLHTNEDGWVELPGPNQSVAIRCKAVAARDRCRVRLVLSWNSFSDSTEIGTNKDLDMVLTDDTLNIVGGSFLVQSLKPDKEGQTLYPREIIDAELKPGRYFIRIKDRSKNFGERDQLRIVGQGENLSFESSDPYESLLNPADNPKVLTVGASDTPNSSRSVRLGKPDILAPSIFDFGNETRFAGSSNAAALVAAAASVLLSTGGTWNLESMKRALGGRGPSPETISPQQLGFGPTMGNCYGVVPLGPQPAYIENLRSQGAIFVQTTQGLKLMMPFDPLRLVPQLRRDLIDDVVAISRSGWNVFSREKVKDMPNDWAEVFAWSSDAEPCQIPPSWLGNRPQSQTPSLRLNNI